MNFFIFDTPYKEKIISAFCMKDNTLLMNTENKFGILEIFDREDKFSEISEIKVDQDIIVNFQYDDLTKKIYYTTKDFKIRCISEDFKTNSEVCLCQSHNIEVITDYESLFYVDIEGSLSSINIKTLMPNKTKYIPNLRGEEYQIADYKIVPEIDRVYILTTKGRVIVYICSTGKITNQHDFSTSIGKIFK